MSRGKNNGGPAFARLFFENGRGDWSDAQDGMSLRDYFAAHAPITFAEACRAWGDDNPPQDDTARAAFFAVWSLLRYEYADAMLFERAKEPSHG